MPLPSRVDFLSSLEPQTCDICYNAMTAPAHTPCGHVYCLRCLLAWVEHNNTCPTCRTTLFESLTNDEEHAIDEDDDTEEDANANVTVNDEEPGVPPLGSIERFCHELTEVLNEREADLNSTSAPRVVTFDASNMAQVVGGFRIEQHVRDAWVEEIKSWDVMYTFVDRDSSNVWTFDHISYDAPSDLGAPGSAVSEQGTSHTDRHVAWAQRISSYLSSIPAIELFKWVRIVRVFVADKPEMIERELVARPHD